MGRFAPSPTGPLHFGSLLAAVASYLDARHHGGQWRVRIEDIDPPREQAGASERIIAALECYGFEWDGPLIYQSAAAAQHSEAVHELLEQGLAYPCSCSRRDLTNVARGSLGTIYPGFCRDGATGDDTAIRLRTNQGAVSFDDGLQGPQAQSLETESGDFIILRRDGLVAYQLAVALDDATQGITDVVRGIDLMDSTPRQIWVQQCLGLTTPRYQHIPVAVHADGSKLSKLTGAAAISAEQSGATLVAALQALGQPTEANLAKAKLIDIWDWAIAHWKIEVLRGRNAVSVAEHALAASNNPLR